LKLFKNPLIILTVSLLIVGVVFAETSLAALSSQSVGIAGALNGISAASAGGIGGVLGDATIESNEGGAPIAGYSWSSSNKKSSGEEHASVLALEARIANHSSLYTNIAITTVDDGFVNIREEANATSEVVGKIYTDSAAHIKDTVQNEEGVWYKIKSGTCEGYIKSNYFVTGAEAEEKAKEVGQLYVTVDTATLRLREQPDINSTTVSLLSGDDKFEVAGEEGDWVKIAVDDDLVGYALNDYLRFSVTYKEAISIEEEKAELARLAELERQRKAAEEQARKESIAASKAAAAKKRTTQSSTQATQSRTTGEAGSGAGSVSSSRWSLVDYAQSWVGVTPYVWGGTSLENGADCSGFVQTIFKKWGIYLSHSSSDMHYAGRAVSAEEMRPGDLVLYSGHVAIYIGDGLVVHASSANSSPNTKISSWNYRSVDTIRNVFGD